MNCSTPRPPRPLRPLLPPDWAHGEPGLHWVEWIAISIFGLAIISGFTLIFLIATGILWGA